MNNGSKKKRKPIKKVKPTDTRTLIGVREELDGIICAHCGCTTFDVYKHVFNIGAYCSKCGKYIKFLNPKERTRLKLPIT